MAYVNPIPANYDASSLSIDPGTLGSIAQTIQNLVTDISNDLSDINKTLTGLNLSWVGTAANAAGDFNTRWTNAVQELFGTQGDPSSGALNTLVGGISSAAQNYSANEDAIVAMFNAFAGGFSTPPSNSNTGTAPASAATSNADAPTDQIHAADGSTFWLYHTTAVNEKF
jgi:uncharacterized protein YukE